MELTYLDQTLVFAFGSGAWTVLAARSIRAPVGALLLRGIVFLSLGISGYYYFQVWLGASSAERLHVHEFYHYYLGSKYYRELGHMDLYECSWRALSDLRGEDVAAPEVPIIRDLAKPKQALTGDALAESADACRENFSNARWREFRGDLAGLIASRPDEQTWQQILGDLGNNSPPTWNLLPSLVAQFVALDAAALSVLPFLDQVILVGLVPFVILRTFGLLPLLGYLLVYFNNPLAGFGWNAGSYFRSLWFALLVFGLCALHTRRYGFAGVFMACSAACRVFPVFFGLAGVMAIAAGRGARAAAMRRFVGTGVVTGFVLLAASLGVFGIEPWIEFSAVLDERINPYGNNSVGLLKLASFYNVVEWPAFAGGGDALNAMHEWLSTVRFDEHRQRTATWFIRGSMIVSGIAVAARVPVATGVVSLGTLLIFALLAPFRYYYVFLALLPLAVYQLKGHRGVSLVVVFGTMVLLRIASVPFQSELGHDPGYFSVSFYSSAILFCGLSLLLACLCWSAYARKRDTGSGPASPRGGVLLALVPLAAVAAGVMSYSLSPAGRDDYHEFQTFRIGSSAEGTSLAVRPATASWGGSDYIDIEYSGPEQAVTFSGPPVAECDCDVTLFFTARADDTDFVVDIDGRSTEIRQVRSDAGLARRVAVKLGRHTITPDTRLTLRPLAARFPSDRPARIGIDGLTLDRSTQMADPQAPMSRAP